MKKLYRSEKDSLVAGIIGGIGEYFDVDPTILRLGFVVLVLLTGVFPGIIAYIIAYFIIPDRPREISILKNNLPIVTPPSPPKPKKEDSSDMPESVMEKPDQPVITITSSKQKPEEKKEQKPETDEKIEYPETEIEAPSIDSLWDERGPDLDDLIEE